MSWIVSVTLAFVSIFTAFAATNTITESGAEDNVIAITPNDFRPPECGMNIQNLVTGEGNLGGTNSNDLILGGSSGQLLRGLNGDDCVLAGAGDDRLRGNRGDDVLLGGIGADNLRGDQNYDLCYGGNDSDTDTAHNTCEETYQIP
jgi:Ca2+-binding RTX toxin-like protein